MNSPLALPQKIFHLALVCLPLIFAGCGGGGGTTNAFGASLQSITVTPANPSIAATTTKQFAATGSYSDSTSQDITAQVSWSSGTTSVATVSAGGLANGTSSGTSLISATLGDISASTTLTVTTLSGYTISGTVSGLSGSGLVLRNNGGDDLAVNSAGAFIFSTALANGQTYQVTVATEPSSPTQGCIVQNGSGTVSGNNISDVSIVCTGGLYNVVDTNQTLCYNSSGVAIGCVGTGYDADYHGNQPSYSVSADGKVVKDNITNLAWTQSTDTDGNNTVNYYDKMYQSDAASYCSNLSLDGYSWRLPSIKELYSLILFSGKDASSYTGTDTTTLTPFIDNHFDWAFGDLTTTAGIAAGDRIIDAQYASTTNYVSTTMLGNSTTFGVNFVDGRIKGYPTSIKKFYVRCVAGSSSYGSNSFTDNGDTTISDSATGLMWEKNDRTSLGWDNAVTACETATTGGHSDWRLPNIKELQSIVDYTRSPATTNSAAIDAIFNSTSFTNEGGTTDWGYYWSSTTHATNSGSGIYATYISFGRALGYFAASGGTQQMLDVHGAGAQRSDHKISAASVPGVLTGNIGYGTFYYHGPQGDIQRSSNMVRCVR